MSPTERFSSVEEEVSRALVQRMHGDWGPQEQASLERRLESDPGFAAIYRLAEESTRALRVAAEMPEMMRFREQAFAHARRSSVRRWLGPSDSHGTRWRWTAGIAASLLAVVAAWQLTPWGYRAGQYETDIGEQRILELEDHSRVALDAQTRVKVRYTAESRTIELLEGQAQFSVAKDATRTFKVQAGNHTIVALGTVFTVEFTDQKVHVAMLDGRVAVVPGNSRELSNNRLHEERGSIPSKDRSTRAVELSAGEELKVSRDGSSTLIPKADLEAATAWRNGKVVFRTERLADAVQRMNRYSHVQLEIGDAALADETVSGVFEAGDTQGFIAGVQLALPVVANYRDSDVVRLTLSPKGTLQRP